MLKPKQMSRLLITASKDQMGPIVAELYRYNLFHIATDHQRLAGAHLS